MVVIYIASLTGRRGANHKTITTVTLISFSTGIPVDITHVSVVLRPRFYVLLCLVAR